MSDNNIRNSAIYIHDVETFISTSELWIVFWNKIWCYVSFFSNTICFAAFYLYRTLKQLAFTLTYMVEESFLDTTVRNSKVESARMYCIHVLNSIENEICSLNFLNLLENIVKRLNFFTSYFVEQNFQTIEVYSDDSIEIFLVSDNLHFCFSNDAKKNYNYQFSVLNFRVIICNDKSIIKGWFRDTLFILVGNFVSSPSAIIDELKFPITITLSLVNNTRTKYDALFTESFTVKGASFVSFFISSSMYLKRSILVLNTLIDVYNEVWSTNKNRFSFSTTLFINQSLILIPLKLTVVEKSLCNHKESIKLIGSKSVCQVQIQESLNFAAKSIEVSNKFLISKFVNEYQNNPANALSLIPSHFICFHDYVTS